MESGRRVFSKRKRRSRYKVLAASIEVLKSFSLVEWLTVMCLRISDQGEQMVWNVGTCRSAQEPGSDSRYLYAGCRSNSKQVSLELILESYKTPQF
jgi:hypothetical protein